MSTGWSVFRRQVINIVFFVISLTLVGYFLNINFGISVSIWTSLLVVAIVYIVSWLGRVASRKIARTGT